MTRRRLTVKARGLPDTRVTFSLEAWAGRVWLSAYDCPHVCAAILEPAEADSLVELINQTATEARRYRP